MPHCQKENHNHATKSKKERLKLKQEAQARKQRLREAAAAAEVEAALKLTNNIAPVEGHGEYEVGYEPEPEYTRFNVKKRSKKHLRNDLRKRMLREQREEEERIRKAQEEEYRKQKQQQENDDDDNNDDEEEELELEYFVFICECCDKRYATKNQFLNHIHSKKHKRKCRIYEDLGLLVTHIELRGENGNEKQVYNDDDDDDDDEEDDEDDDEEDAKDSKKKNNNKNNNNEGNKNKNTARVRGTCSNRNGTKNNNNSNDDSNDDDESDNNHSEERSESESEDDDDEYYVAPSRSKNVFAGFATGFGDDSSSSSSEEEDSDDDDEEREEDETRQPRAAPPKVEDASDDEESDIDFDELIRQNQLLQKELDAKQKEEQATTNNNNYSNGGKELVVPLPFHETYDPDDYDTNEQRLVSVQHRLRKNLASRGIAPKKTRAPTYDYDPLDAIAMGKTLLQQVLESNTETLQQRLEAYRRHKKDCELVAREFALARGNSKALPAQYVHKQDAADNARFRANVHHAGSHYHMQMARSMQFGRHKGMMARHSSQGARLQASRMAMAARMESGGANKVGKKTSKKKSQQKRRGEAGGSKKTGGYKGGDGGD